MSLKELKKSPTCTEAFSFDRGAMEVHPGTQFMGERGAGPEIHPPEQMLTNIMSVKKSKN